MSVAGVFPAIARNFISLAHAAGGKHNRFGGEDLKPPFFALVTECSDSAALVFQQRYDCALHVHINTLMDAVVLKDANHF